MPKRPRKPLPPPTPPICRESLGVSPAVLANRDIIKVSAWCPAPQNIEFDPFSNPHHPLTISFRNCAKADEVMKDILLPTPLVKSKCCKRFGMELYLKMENVHKTGSFHERAAIYALLKLTDEQKRGGVVTASTGNWAMALAYQGQLLNILVTVVLPVATPPFIVDRCRSFDAIVVQHGETFADAKRRAFVLIAEQGHLSTYLNGYDHPNVIAGTSTIAFEILDQLDNVDVIIVPIGGGGLIAAISVVAKHYKPSILIYGCEPSKSCNFFKAMDNESPYQTKSGDGLASSLGIPSAGENAFHTARSHIDKLVLVDDDWIARAMYNLAEEEKVIVEGAGAISLGTLMCLPNLVPELKGKRVVAIVTGGNIAVANLFRVFKHAKAIEGQHVTVKIRECLGNHFDRYKIFRVIENLGCNIISFDSEREWLTADNIMYNYITLQCETRNIRHAYTLKNVMEKLFPNACEFRDEPFKLRTMCSCFPTR